MRETDGQPGGPRIVAICGARRTGTTLVNQILCSDPGANAQVGEARLATQLLQVFAWGNENYDNVVKWYFASPDEYRAYFRDIIGGFVRLASAQLRPSTTLVLKTPAFALVIDEALELMANSRFLVCVRSPFDQVASDFEVGLRQAERGMKAGARAARRNIAGYARTYLAHYEKVLAASGRHPDRFVFLRYEDLLNDTAATLERLAADLDMDLSRYDPEAPWADFLNKDELARMPAHVEQYGGPMDRSRIGRHAGVLTPEEIQSVAGICAPIIEWFGYPTDGSA